MDFITFLQELLIAIVTVGTPIVVAYLVKLLDAKKKEVDVKISDDYIRDAFDTAVEAIENSVDMVSQTYVDDLKKQGNFDAEAQKHALSMSVEAAKSLITEDGIIAIERLFGDFEAYLVNKIEATVKANK